MPLSSNNNIKKAGVKIDPTLAKVQKLQEEREKRRLAQEEAKKNKAQEALDFNAKGKVGDIEYLRMIEDYRIKRGDTARQHQPPGSTRITICIRKRPVNTKEINNNDFDSVTVCNPEVTVHECKLKVDGITKYLENTNFYFDHAFSETSETNELYIYAAKPLIDFVLSKGGKATCFAYGQTGSGKTYTMSQIQQQSGQEIFKAIKSDAFKGYKILVSFFEIYGSRVLDLLKKREKLRIMEDGNHKVQVLGLTEIVCGSQDELSKYITLANQARTTSVTEVHDQSSRSHAICNITLLDREDKEYGKLALIDLAGSERASETSSHDRQKRLEGAEINKSLLALKECIRALDNNQSHIPFRASKLTQVLRDSFQGQARTSMICTISPTSTSADHTLNTLRYADRIKENDSSLGLNMPLESKVSNSSHEVESKNYIPKKPAESKYSYIPSYPSPAIKNKGAGVEKKRVVIDDVDIDDDEEEELNDIDFLHQSIRLDKNSVGKENENEEIHKLHQTVTLLITEEDKLLQTHLVVIKETANLLSEEGVLLKTYQNSEDPDLDSYVERLTSIINKKSELDNALKRQLEKCKKLMRREEELAFKNKKKF